MDPHWSETFEHEALTDDNRESFGKAMSKFATVEDAAVGYMELQKTAGKPFKLPESLDKLDDSGKAEFSSKAMKLLGVEHAASVDELELDTKTGAHKDYPVSDEVAADFKKYVVDNKIPKATAQKMMDYYKQLTVRAAEHMEADNKAKTAAIKEALLKEYGTQNTLDAEVENLKKAVKYGAGLSPEEAEEFGDALADSMLGQSPLMARVMLKVLAPLGKTVSHDKGGGRAPVAQKDPDVGSPTYKALGW